MEENINQTRPATRRNGFTNEEEAPRPLLISASPTDQRILAAPPHTDPLPELIDRAVNATGQSPGVDLEEHVGPSLQEDPLPGETPLPYAPNRETPHEDISVQNHPDYAAPDQGEEPPNDKIMEGDAEVLIGVDAGPVAYPGQDTSEYSKQWDERKDAMAEGTPSADLPPIEPPFVGNTVADHPEDVAEAVTNPEGEENGEPAPEPEPEPETEEGTDDGTDDNA